MNRTDLTKYLEKHWAQLTGKHVPSDIRDWVDRLEQLRDCPLNIWADRILVGLERHNHLSNNHEIATAVRRDLDVKKSIEAEFWSRQCPTQT